MVLAHSRRVQTPSVKRPCGTREPRPLVLHRSKQKLQLELEPARVVRLSRAGDLAEGRRRDAELRRGKKRVIERVEGLGVEPNPVAVRNQGVLDQRNIEVVLARTAQPRE